MLNDEMLKGPQPGLEGLGYVHKSPSVLGAYKEVYQIRLRYVRALLSFFFKIRLGYF